MTRVTACAIVLVALASCGDEGDIPDEIEPQAVYAGRCESPRSGLDINGERYTDAKGSTLTEKLWVRSWIDELYLWYDEVPDVDMRPFPNAVEYFDVMKSEAVTPSGRPKDQFHFTVPTAEWLDQSQSGVSAGYGAQWILLANRPPRRLVVAYVQDETPAAEAGLQRGDEITLVDGEDLRTSNNVEVLNAGLFPAPGQSHSFGVLARGTGVTRTVTMTSAAVKSAPVLTTQVLVTPTGRIGYMVFNDHIATAEAALIASINQLRDAGVTDLVLDIRYNGGGFLAIAAQLGYMIAGPAATSGKVFERLMFNDKSPSTNPVTGGPLGGTPFIDETIGFSAPEGQDLPSLGLSRVFVLTGSGTCSASEAVMNGLAGIDLEVIQIGAGTCGKPYGFYPTDNCGTTYFAIQFKGVNNKDFGDYADGFVPGGLLRGCTVADDFTHDLGDPAEARLAAALAYRASGTCTAARTGGDPLGAAEGTMLKPAWLQNRIATRDR